MAVAFGLTGGIASGKSTVGRSWRGRGLPVIDADSIAHAVLSRGSAGHVAVVTAFGEHFLDCEGQMDRKALGRHVFKLPSERKRLEAITHPLIAEETARQLDVLRDRGCPLACYEAALLVESGRHNAFRPLVVVVATQAAQLERMRARDGLSLEEARARIAAQLPLEQKAAVADYVIANDGSLDELLLRADDVLRRVCKTLGVAAEGYGL